VRREYVELLEEELVHKGEILFFSTQFHINFMIKVTSLNHNKFAYTIKINFKRRNKIFYEFPRGKIGGVGNNSPKT